MRTTDNQTATVHPMPGGYLIVTKEGTMTRLNDFFIGVIEWSVGFAVVSTLVIAVAISFNWTINYLSNDCAYKASVSEQKDSGQ